MINRKYMLLFIIISYMVVIIVNVYIPMDTLWMLLLIPALGVGYLYPKWLISLIVGATIVVTTLITKYIAQESNLSSELLFRLVIIWIAMWAIFTLFLFLRKRSLKLISELEKLAFTDALTKIHNRRYLEMYMDKAIPLAERQGQPLTMIMFDIDHFKSINDTYGHGAGDIILKRMGQKLKEILRKSDVFIRVGGEEFIIISPSCSLSEGLQLAERIRKAVERIDFIYNQNRIQVTISVGIAEYVYGLSLNEFLESVDKALYLAKESGRNRVMVAKDSIVGVT